MLLKRRKKVIKVVELTVTKKVELSAGSELWQLNEDQLRETFLSDLDDWDSVDVKLETYDKEITK